MKFDNSWKSKTTRFQSILVFLMSPIASSFATAQDERFAGSPFLPGLKATYTGNNGKSHKRLDHVLAFDWSDRAPDPRLPRGPFQVRWQGRLFTQTPGDYTFHVYVSGKVELDVAGQTLIKSARKQTGWIQSKPIKLAFGRHPIAVRFQSTNDSPRISLYWSGPDYQLEPVAARRLWHDRDKNKWDDFRNGRLLVRALRCAACHSIHGKREPIPAPALDAAAGNIDAQWLTDWLCNPPKKDETITRCMPHFGMNRADAEAITAFLLTPAKRKTPARKPTKGDKAVGKKLFFTVGCIACHTVNGVGDNGLFGGGDLSTVAHKRPPGFFQQWLDNPAKINRHHRMPVFKLSKKEQSNLAAFLNTLRSSNNAKPRTKNNAAGDLVKRGKLLVKAYRCYQCHEIPGVKQGDSNQKTTILSAESNWSEACSQTSNAKKKQPGYFLTTKQAESIRGYVASITSSPKHATKIDGKLVLAERNCLSCHSRGWSLGMSEHLQSIREAHPDLAAELTAVAPPSLESVGDKFQDELLRKAIRGELPPRRPWLHIRMPRFSLNKGEVNALAHYFVTTDRIPKFNEASPSEPDEKKLNFAGRRLVGAGGFSCISCHKVGKVRPKGVAPNVLGPDLSKLGKMVRRSWFDRFVRNPLRAGLAMEMPSLTVPVANVLDENLDHQLAAVWHVLNQKGFNPPRQAIVRVVRQRTSARSRHANVLTDVLHAGERKMIKPFLIGLTNRHNLLFDLETGQLAGWWVGDTASQWTEGKSWFWAPAGRSVMPIAIAQPEVALAIAGKRITPRRKSQFITEFDEYEHDAGGIRFSHRLRFDKTNLKNDVVLRIRQSFLPIGDKNGRSGFRRVIDISGIPDGAALEIRLSASQVDAGETHIEVVTPADARPTVRDDLPYLRLAASKNGNAVCAVNYLTTVRDLAPKAAAPDVDLATKINIKVLPGYTATRLPLPKHLMPTALAWRNDGVLVAASLRGKVWLIRDTDSDGIEDAAAPFSDELAAPYGVVANQKSLDVLNKYALLRLFDDNSDGRADRITTLASGWGHTADYHDWAVGPVRDGKGGYYIALPCRQDDRINAAAHLRGSALRLTSRKPTATNPFTFRIEKLCDGLRFPMGLALSRDGNLFCTDNQGNYNPFNELNHLEKGKHYGFYNRYEPKRVKPLTPPAIDIPHPWTRSVNGLCFLDTPEKLRKKLGRSVFGPFEGHLLGCEYNNRSLIRMTLQKVGDIYQGACYPFTVAPMSGQEKFLGPICCAVSPDGDLYVGNMHDSGWSGGQNTGSIVRLRPGKEIPTGIAEVHATPTGFAISFTAPIERKRGNRLQNYSISSYRRISTPSYGGKDVDRRDEKIKSVSLSADGRMAILTLGRLREGSVYELRVSDLVDAEQFMHPSEAHYTLRRIPEQ